MNLNEHINNPTNQTVKYIGFGRRLGAFAIDIFFLLLVMIGINAIALVCRVLVIGEAPEVRTGALTLRDAIDLLAIGLHLFISVGYFVWFWATTGQTPGKRQLGSTVMSIDGSSLSWGQASLRFIGYIISGLVFLLGFIWIAFDAKRQGWHDKIAGTCVVYEDTHFSSSDAARFGQSRTWQSSRVWVVLLGIPVALLPICPLISLLLLWSTLSDPCDTPLRVGEALYHKAQYPEALNEFQGALVCYRDESVGNQAGEVAALNNIGNVYQNQGHYAEALANYQQALTLAWAVGDRAGEVAALNNIGNVYQSQGHYVEASDSFQQALTVAREVGDRAGEGAVLISIGNMYQNHGRYAQALDSFQQALTIAREIGNRVWEGAALIGIGNVYQNHGRYKEALEAYEQALAIRREMGDRAGEGAILTLIAEMRYEKER